ncbi:MAG: CDP-alcohol phosphatidyltransferase family protein [Salinibacter sp.]
MSSLPPARRIERWSLVNAVGMLLATAVAGGLRSPWPLLGAGGVLLTGLIVVARRGWTPQGPFGWANGVTVLRGGLLAGLPPAADLGVVPVIGLCLLFLGADGLDGWLARRADQTSEFGAFLDKETDALFLLLLCAVAAFQNRLPVWVIGAGLLRYVFVTVVFLLDPPRKTEERSNLARYLYGGMVGALLLSFLPYPAVYRPLVILAAGTLAVSFGRSLWWIVPRGQAFGETDGRGDA